MCDFHGRTLLVVTDDYSNFIEVENWSRRTSGGVIQVLKGMFARYGVPDKFVSDNGPQIASEEFGGFARKWKFEHIT